MPTVFYKFGLRYYFVSYDCSEPCQIHVSDDARKICKFWLRNQEVVMADNNGFRKIELSKIKKEIEEHYKLINTKFNEHCKGFQK